MKEMTLREIENLLGEKIKIVADKPSRTLANIPVGETFKVGDMEFIVLEHTDFGTNVILKDFWKTANFDDDTSNYAKSKIRKELNKEFYNKLSALVGTQNIVEHTVDLTTDDGRKDYGSVTDAISLLTCDMYRRYVDILDKYNTKKWWWLATSWSTAAKGYSYAVRCVNINGSLDFSGCYDNGGVRPFCRLVSSISVS
jgi:hypothetical protein